MGPGTHQALDNAVSDIDVDGVCSAVMTVFTVRHGAGEHAVLPSKNLQIGGGGVNVGHDLLGMALGLFAML